MLQRVYSLLQNPIDQLSFWWVKFCVQKDKSFRIYWWINILFDYAKIFQLKTNWEKIHLGKGKKGFARTFHLTLCIKMSTKGDKEGIDELHKSCGKA